MSATFNPKREEIERDWYVVDAAGVTFGRLCTTVARILTGKNKPIWAPHVDTGDFVVVINAEQVVLTGRKEEKKIYYRHSTHPGGLKSETAGEMLNRRPERLIERGVRGMLPKSKLGRKQFRKLRVYPGASHRHEAQKPQTISVA